MFWVIIKSLGLGLCFQQDGTVQLKLKILRQDRFVLEHFFLFQDIFFCFRMYFSSFRTLSPVLEPPILFQNVLLGKQFCTGTSRDRGVCPNDFCSCPCPGKKGHRDNMTSRPGEMLVQGVFIGHVLQASKRLLKN